MRLAALSILYRAT